MPCSIRGLLYGVFGQLLEKLCGCKLLSCLTEDAVQDNGVSYESALVGIDRSGKNSMLMLNGTPTYRMPHHPLYKDMFSNPMYKPLWFRAFGRARYSRLVSGHKGCTFATVILRRTIKEQDQPLQACEICICYVADVLPAAHTSDRCSHSLPRHNDVHMSS